MLFGEKKNEFNRGHKLALEYFATLEITELLLTDSIKDIDTKESCDENSQQ